MLFPAFLFVLAAYNLSKLPWYLGLVPIPSYGLEASMPFHRWTGYRGSKLWSHPVLFLAPHAVMGSSLLVLHALYLLDYYRQDDNMLSSATAFFGLAAAFAVHVFPERAGIPNRSKKLPLNEACMMTIAVGVGLVAAGIVDQGVGRTIVIVPCLGAPILELIPVLAHLVKKIGNSDYRAASKDGDQPLTRNMAGYSGICPFARSVDISTRDYPSSSRKD